MSSTHSTSSQSSGDSHHMPYLGQDMEQRSSSSGSSSNQKVPYVDSRSMGGSSSELNRHRGMPSSSDPNKRGLPHGAPVATNGSSGDSLSSCKYPSLFYFMHCVNFITCHVILISWVIIVIGKKYFFLAGGSSAGGGAGDSHVPSSKNAYRSSAQPPSSTFGQTSQDLGANKYHAAAAAVDGFGTEFGMFSSSSSSSNIMSIEDRRKRRLAEGMSLGNAGSNSNKRPRSEAYVSSVPIPSNSLFSPEELSEASTSSSSSHKRFPALTSQFSPSALDATPSGYNKFPERSSQLGSLYDAGVSSDGIMFGSSATESKPDIRSRVNPAAEFQAPDLLQPIGDTKVDLTSSAPPPREASLFSPELVPDVCISPPAASITDSHSKRDLFSNLKQDNADAVSLSQASSNSYSESISQPNLSGRLSNSPPRRESGEDSHSSKKSKKSKKEKHKHKHKDEKKHKKDKHKDKEKDKEKKDKHRSKDKHSSSSAPVEVTNDVPSHRIKIKLGRDDSKSSASIQPSSSSSSSSRHSSSRNSSSSAAPLPALKVKISSKARVSSIDDDVKHSSIVGGGSSPGDEPTPCCPGFGPCLTCNRETSQDQYRFFSSEPVGLTMKFAKSKDGGSKSSSSKESSSSSKDSKKSKDKTSKSSSSGSAYNTLPMVITSGGRLSSSHHAHKNGMEKSSKKKDKSAV